MRRKGNVVIICQWSDQSSKGKAKVRAVTLKGQKLAPVAKCLGVRDNVSLKRL